MKRGIEIKGLMTAQLSLALVCGSLWCALASAETSPLVVVYPEVRQPFAQVYQTIADGAEKGYGSAVHRLELANGLNSIDLIGSYENEIVIALGGRPVKQLLGKQLDHPLIVGAISVSIDGVLGLTMVPDPEAIVQRLQVLVPSVKNIYVVDRPKGNVMNVATAKVALEELGLNLVIKQAADIRDAAIVYRELVEHLDADDSVWILPGDRFVNNALLSMLLEASWKSDFVVFSSNPTHVKRGALFSVYPDNFKMGVRLGEIALGRAQGNEQAPAMEPLTNVFVTVNERTSNHLGITLTDDKMDYIDLVLPAR